MSNSTFNLQQPWDIVKEYLKENDHRINEDDLAYDPGNVEPLLERLSKKLGRTKEEIRILIESLSANSGKAS